MDESKLSLLKKKLSFPHEKFDKIEDIQNCNVPLEKEDYRSSLTESTVSDEMMDRIRKFWTTFHIVNLLQYGTIF